METINAIGRRKMAVARIYLTKGKGEIKVNRRELAKYFSLEAMRIVIKQPLEKTELVSQYNVSINVTGGGVKGQAEAIRLGIARALCKEDITSRAVLKKEGYLTRDPRRVERKKYGHKKARKESPFRKR